MRVSTHFGLEEGPNSFLAHLSNLTDIPLAEHFIRIEPQGSRVFLFRAARSSLSPNQLAMAMALRGQVAAHPMAEGVVVEMVDPGAAAMVRLTDKGLKRYEKTSFEPGRRLELTRCLSGAGPHKIVVRNVTQDEEWRLLLAREVDLVPVLSPSYLRYLRDVSVRIVPVSTLTPAALAFRVRAPSPTANGDLRRAISRGILRQALVESIDGNQAEAVKMDEDRGEARRGLERLGIHAGARRSLRLFFDESVADFRRVALVIEQQLAPLGIVLDIQALGFDALLDALEKGNFDMILHRVGLEKRYWSWLRAAAGYDSPKFKEATEQGDDAAAHTILEWDLPLTPLYLMHEGVVLDNYFCGAAPMTVTDLSWLAAVHPCKPGENQ